MFPDESVALDPQTLLSAYAQGLFPMTDHEGVIRWYTADPRGIIPLEDTPHGFHASHKLVQLVRRPPDRGGFEIKIDTAFEQVMRSCKEVERRPAEGIPGSGGGGSWINDEMVYAYLKLHRLGFAHSVETWRDDQLVGGLYGISLGAAFFGESMFHRHRDASKVALVHLVQRLRERGYELLDTQAVTPHLQRFGAQEISAETYELRLRQALTKVCRFN